MRYRYTIDELSKPNSENYMSDAKLLRAIVSERQSSCTNIYSPLYIRLQALSRKLDKTIEAEESDRTATEYITFREVLTRYPSLKDKDYKQHLFSDVVAEYGYQIKPDESGNIDCGDGEYSDYKGYLNVLLFEVTE